MKRSASPLPVSGIEVLEGRIAPATILVGAPPAFGFNDTNYDEAPFVNTETNPADSISKAVGGGAPGVADTFYLSLKKGDRVQLFNGSNSFEDFIVVNSGSAVAFFIDDYNGAGANEVSANEFVGLALGKGASVDVKGSVFGDVVTNLKDDGTLDMDPNTHVSSLVSSKQNILGLNIGANITGSIFSGGPIANVKVGNVTQILAGSAADTKTFDFFPGVQGGDGTISVTPVLGEAGPGISKVKVDTVTGSIAAGAGGAGANGGAIDTIEVTQDTDGLSILGGAGGSFAGAKISGGAGGAVSNVFITGVNDPTPNSAANGAGPAAYNIFAGNGGNGTALGKGGPGGKLTNIYVGYEKAGKAIVQSFNQIEDSVALHSGVGGDGKVGGAGGAIVTSKVSVSTREANGNEIEVVAGAGGNVAAGTIGGAAGIGGSIATLDLQNQDDNLLADLYLQAGNGGTTVGTAAGAAGGSITGVTILAAEVKAFAGNGSDGKTGGIGGNVSTLTFTQRDSIITTALEVDAGFGGVGSGGNGGKGGDVKTIKVESGDFSSFKINAGVSGNGGNATGGRGGVGGIVLGVDVIDIDTGNSGAFSVRGGLGGDGTAGGGAGGKVDSVTLFAVNLEPTLTAGDGGKASITGVGGAGGLVNNLNIAASGLVMGNLVSGVIKAGIGGAGTAAITSGGAGGDVKLVNLTSDLNVTVTAGNGGDAGASAAPGRGGSIYTTAAFGLTGFGVMSAGNAGINGLKAAAGGSILGGKASQLSALRADTTLTVTAGNGSHGGAGGDIIGFAFGSPSLSLAPTPSGNILIQAGNGSAEGRIAGRGGNIDRLNGGPSSGANTTTKINAGDGGGTATSTASGIGGTVSNVTISGVGDDFLAGNQVVITIEAGDAGVAPNALVGGAGGNVTTVGLNNLDPDVIFRSVAAGDGGNGINRGGLGGTINGVDVVGGIDPFSAATLSGDIGVRSGQAYGFTTMGGVFAGVGGTGTVAGLAGSVRNVSAAAIASIVAGKTQAAPALAEKVELISVGGSTGTDLLKFSEQDLVDDGGAGDPNYYAFNTTSFATNNLVGAVMDPSRQDANKFAYTDSNNNGLYDLGEVPTDGLIAAKNLVTDTLNFVPEAQYVKMINGKVQQAPTTEIAPGSATVHEQQQYSFNLSVGTYALSFKGVSTAALPKNAAPTDAQTATDVQTALNGLSTIPPGGVTVTSTHVGTVYTLTITFAAFGNQIPIYLQPQPFFDYDNKL